MKIFPQLRYQIHPKSYLLHLLAPYVTPQLLTTPNRSPFSLGNYCLTLVDSLSTLAIIGNQSEFRLAVQRVIDVVHFDKNSTVRNKY